MHFEKREKYLLICNEGERNNFLSVAESAENMFAIIKESHYSHVLLDYRGVNYNLPQSQAFNLVRYYEQKFPGLTQITLAAVANHENEKIASLWSEITEKRGFRFKAFTDFDEAEKWLLSQHQ